MRVYCGTDIIEVKRIKESIESNSEFVNKIYTKSEIEDIEKINNKDVKYQRYAGRFAAKEAVYKALSKLLSNSNTIVNFNDFEIINDEDLSRRPYINVLNKEANEKIDFSKIEIDISISHVKDTAIAMAIVKQEE